MPSTMAHDDKEGAPMTKSTNERKEEYTSPKVLLRPLLVLLGGVGILLTIKIFVEYVF